MNVKRHCDLCEHQILSLKEGTVCGLTNKKPSFTKTCLKIYFNKKIKTNLECLLVDLKLEKKNKYQIILSLIINTIFGVVLILVGYLFFQSMLEIGFAVSYSRGMAISTGIMISGGVYLLRKPFLEIRYFNKVISKNKKELFKIEEVLTLYNKSYKSDITFGKEIHGTQDIQSEITIL